MKKAFNDMYERNLSMKIESVSGFGSTVHSTKELINKLPLLIDQYNIKSILDAPCGDFNWMQHVNLNIDKYIGVDIVSENIQRNNQHFSNENREFHNLDISTDLLPKVDLILCRDCLVHFSYKDIWSTLKNFKSSNSKYLLTTTFTSRDNNLDIQTGKWRTLNLEKAPFHFPKPLFVLNEKCPEGNGMFSDKSLALWKLDNIPPLNDTGY